MDITCNHCGKTVTKKWTGQKFCSQSCAASFNNKGVRRYPKSYKTCRRCSNVVEKNRTFCPSCIKEGHSHIHCLNLENARTDHARRKWLIRKSGLSCWVCKLSEWQGQPIPIEIDHINGNASDNTEANLRLICPNCHAQTSNYKGKNKGKGSRKFHVVFKKQ